MTDYGSPKEVVQEAAQLAGKKPHSPSKTC
jgi:hypothetical protein